MKNNFKKLAVIAGIFALSQNVNAQTEKGFYVGVNAGYAANVGGTTNLSETFELFNSTEQADGSETFEYTKVGLGKGMNFGITAGYMFNKNIGAELGINYLMGGKSEFTETYLDGTNVTKDIKGKMLQFKPTLVLTAGYSKINPYAKFGLTFGQASAEATYASIQGTNTFNAVREIEGGMSLGFHSGIGLNYAITSKLTLFGEILYTGVTFRPETATITSATANGIDVLGLIDTEFTHTEFVTDFNTNEPQNQDLPTKERAVDIPFNNLGLNVGVKFAL
jgi:opacity protein-like surface antigen